MKMMTLIKIIYPRALLAIIAGIFMTAQAMAADDVTARALKLYEKHYYEEAARLLRPELAKMEGSRQAEASLALGMIYLGSAQVYAELHKTALLVELDYLTRLSKQRTDSSRFADFYLGQALLEAGSLNEAVNYLQRYANKIGAKSPFKPYVDIELGIAYSHQKQQQKAMQAWSSLDLSKPELKAALAGAYAVVGGQGHKALAMADAALSEAKAQRYTPGMRMSRNLLRAYSREAAPDKALDLLYASELNQASYVEEIGASKSIRFYDASLLQDLARTHLHAAVQYLEQAGRDAKLGSSASYYLADAYLQQGNAGAALRADASALAQAQLPAQYSERARIHQASAQYMAGQRKQAVLAWQSLAEKSAADPLLLAAVMQACARAGADCAKIETLALAVVEKGEGKKIFPLNAALGKYYLQRKDYPKALLYMEAGRDKAYKNKIEVNDPEMLIGLAEAYYRNKKYSENLEIYFEIGKQFPVVRQIQEAMQGIYSLEQQSAGDVKIF